MCATSPTSMTRSTPARCAIIPDLPLNEAIAKVTEKTAEQYHKDAAALGCLEPTHEPRATEHIDGMIAMIQTLIDKGNAYVADGPRGAEVLFAIRLDAGLRRLSNRKLDEQQAGARIAVEDHKRNPAISCFGRNRPPTNPAGTAASRERGRDHPRPSRLAHRMLGDERASPGRDLRHPWRRAGPDLPAPRERDRPVLLRPRHDRMANLWMHNGFLQVEGRKMSKSEGNFVTIAECWRPKNSAAANGRARCCGLAMLMTHYREPIDFSVPFAALVVVENLSWTRGEPAYFQSSNLVRRGFCRDCGTPLTYEFEGSHIDITIASLDQPNLVAPEIQLGLENRLSWCEGLAVLPTRTEEAEAAAQDVFSNIRNHQHPDRDTEAWPETTR
jgi:hypothetical protein